MSLFTTIHADILSYIHDKHRLRRTAEDVIEIGLALIRQKGRLPHGAFLPWIESEFGMSQQTSMRFMAVAERYGSIKPSNLELLPPSALYELAAPSTPPEVRSEVEVEEIRSYFFDL